MTWRHTIVALCIVSATLSAQNCDREIYGGVELLYWKATNCHIPFAVGENNEVNNFNQVKEFSKRPFDYKSVLLILKTMNLYFCDKKLTH